MAKLTKDNEKFLKEELNITSEEFKSMEFFDLDTLVDNRLVAYECLNDDSFNCKMATEIIDIIYGPY
ncbi:MAG: hypothetical protein LBM93_01270 [Oscillospiraceae bacterium]|nr:hypothetical protein [Oscillospiraceae bacterium]